MTQDPAGEPLAGRTVVVTRPRSRAAGMVEALRARGARVILAPAIEILPPERPERLRRAVAELDRFDWVVLTSASAVRSVARAWEAPRTRPVPRRLAAVGPSTAGAARELGWSVDLVPDEYTGEGLLRSLEREVRPLAGATMLLLLAEDARDVLPEGLRARGVDVTRVVAYRTGPAAPGAGRVAPEEPSGPAEPVVEPRGLADALREGSVDLLTFTAPSTAERFLEAVGPEALTVPAAAIGPVTAGAARGLGFRVEVVADPHTVEGLVSAVAHHFSAPAGPPPRTRPPSPEAPDA